MKALAALARSFARIGLIFSVLLCVSCTRSHGAAKSGAAHRIVSISPSTTETLFAIGAGSAVVGRSRYCDYPPEVLKLPQVGGYVDPNLEAILALDPDLVVGARGPIGMKLTDALGARSIATYFPETETFAQIDDMILGLGARTGHDADAKSVVDRVHARIAEVEASNAGRKRPRVLLVFGLDPVVAAGPGSFADEMVRRAGADNAMTGTAHYPTLGIENVLAMDPDVVVNAAMAETHGAQKINAETPGWQELRAVKAGHVAAVTDESVLRPGPRIGDGLATLADAIRRASP